MDVIVKGSPSIEIGFERKVVDSYKAVDTELSETSKNPVENAAITKALQENKKETDSALQSLEKSKASIDGRYPEMSVGFADDLVGRGESVPAEFSFRASGGKSIKDGTARVKRLKGNSVVWNQKLIRDNETTLGITTTWVDNIATLSGTATSTYAEITDSRVPIFNGHKYLVEGWVVSNPNGLSFGLGLFNNIPEQLQFDSSTAYKAGVFICNGNYRSGFGVNRFGGAGTDLTGLQLKARVTDLTQMFEAGNEPTTIEEFNARKPIVEDEYAYNEGEVIHMTAEGIKSVGDNAWDEEWELGNINSSGLIDSDSRIRSKNFTRVIPNETYYFHGVYGYGIFFYDADKNYVTTLYVNNNKLQIPSNAVYLKFNFPADYGVTYKGDYMISLVHSGWKQDTDAAYQPYWEDTLPLPIIRKYFPQGMKSAGTAHDEIRYNKASGKWEYSKGKIKSVDMGTLSWSAVNVDTLPNVFHAKIADIITPSASADYIDGLLCTRYGMSTKPAIANMEDMSMLRYNGYVYVKDTSCANTSELKSALSGVMLYYESNDWEWVELDAEDQNFRDYYNVADFGTEQAIAETNSAPISADIIYQFNAVDMIREHELEIAELQSIIATMQAQLASLTSNNE